MVDMKDIYEEFHKLQNMNFEKIFSNPTLRDVEELLLRDEFELNDLPILLSDSADAYLEDIAQLAARKNLSYWGKAVSLFTPLYISNYCTNGCLYCSFSKGNKIKRKQLSLDEVRREAQSICKTGLRNILVLTGEAEKITTFSYLKESLAVIVDYFSDVAIEIYPLEQAEYSELVEKKLVDSLTIYQETYNEKLYSILHPVGKKSDYHYRLETTDRAARAGIRALTIGALLGLDDFKRDLYFVAMHLAYLQKNYTDIELSVAFPRMRPLVGDFEVKHPVSDRELVRIISAFRLIFPSVGITMSTREEKSMRDGCIPIGVTKVSAGVSTAVGGHSGEESTTQFEIADNRSVAEMVNDIASTGLQPVMNTWNMKMNVVEKRL